MISRASFVLFFLLLSTVSPRAQATRIKDLSVVHGVRSNQLFGYGLVLGLKGTGDSSQSRFTMQSLAAMLGRMGVRIDPQRIRARNVAAVMVTADLPPFSRAGSRIDVLVSSIGNARSLQGGTLLFTPLRGADGKVYALAQGPLSLGGFGMQSGSSSVSKNHVTVGRIPQGALVEREIPSALSNTENIQLDLLNPDFTTAKRIIDTINKALGAELASAADPGTIQIAVPEKRRNNLVSLVAELEGLSVTEDIKARVVINERSGTIVMGENVSISTVAISHGSLYLEVHPNMQVSQPGPFSSGETVTAGQDQVVAEEVNRSFALVEQSATLGEVVRTLNSIGATTRDMIEILQAIRAAGALPATLDII